MYIKGNVSQNISGWSKEPGGSKWTITTHYKNNIISEITLRQTDVTDTIKVLKITGKIRIK